MALGTMFLIAFYLSGDWKRGFLEFLFEENIESCFSLLWDNLRRKTRSLKSTFSYISVHKIKCKFKI